MKRREPIIHFASSSDAEELAHNGPALCRAGMAHRTEREQVVSGNWEYVTCKTCHRLLKAHNEREDRKEARSFTFTQELHQRAEREGWGIFNDSEVQRLDDDDVGRGYLLADDDEAIVLARAAGVPVKDEGTLDCERLIRSDSLDWFVVTLRRNGDDEDSLYIVQAEDAMDASVVAETQFREENGMVSREAYDETEDEIDCVYINHVVQCEGTCQKPIHVMCPV